MKGDDISSSFYLCNLFYMLNVFMISDYICIRVHLYTIAVYTNGAFMKMYPSLVLVTICVMCHRPGVFYY